MNALKNSMKVAALTCLFSGAGMAALVSAQDDTPPVPPGYEHTGVKWHTGQVGYLEKQNDDGTWVHTGIKVYKVAYKLKKIEVDPTK
ncbi:hypothetical protein [Engelhardtia mirabilis]|uniref:SLA1 homology domain-containing protein n=1 Tax=Engelhardtia mirabilis TaxID=2528011 RepID=A0A518BJ29_9BACT|nr:hypothetical protein Pla133_20290 [Planctomycetes bacterium Pla133]QDV01281.1 hypothetical protein Pla86_20300 [Planctomycetes bacterium Pla86]